MIKRKTMKQKFEDYTHELTVYEMKVIIPAIVELLHDKIGKSKAIKNNDIISTFNGRKIKTNPSRIRMMIHLIRNECLIERLMATAKGYYISNDAEEMESYIKSLEQRSSRIQKTKISFQNQLLKYQNKGTQLKLI